MRKLRSLRSLNPYGIHHFGVAAIAAGIGAAGSIASAAMQSGGAAGAAGLQTEYLDLGIDELRNALGPSMARLDREQAWSDRHLRNQFRKGMRETAPYAQAGARGLSRLNYLMGTDSGLGPQPTAPKAPKQPKYSKDPKTAAAQKKAYQKALRAYDRAKTQFGTDSAAWDAASKAQASDPSFGALMKPYEDRFEGRIDEAGRQILDVASERYQDKYAPEILEVSRDKFDRADFEVDPGYEFRRSEGNRGIEQSAAARGNLQSGAAMKELTRFNQDTASNEFDRAHGRWADVRNTRLGALTGQQGFDYGVWDANKGARLGALGSNRDTLINQRNFDFGNFEDNRDFQYGALTGMVGVGQDATDDRNQLREHFSGQRTGNRLRTAGQLGDWRQANAATIAQFLAAQGGAQAAGQINQANAWGNAFEGAGNALGAGIGYYRNNGRYAPGDRRGGDAPIRNIYPQ